MGTRLSAEINLAAQLAMLVGLWFGFFRSHRAGTQASKHPDSNGGAGIAGTITVQ